MVKDTKSVEQYLADIGPGSLDQFKRIEGIVNTVIPDHSTCLSYGMPTFKYKGKTVLHFGVFKDHLSIFPGSGSVYERMGEKIDTYRTSKGTLQFTLDKPISDELVAEIVQIRLADINAK